ncbi:MAG: branched-chain amino acid transaminase [Candidatus Nanohaloarchaea archaeon]|nr:branched-chain amino acid transaminase [Candidatus Nanohaloarchaea archaeon]
MEDVDTIWMDGDQVAWEDAQVHVLTHALHYGSAVFEGIRAYDTGDGTAVFRLDAHLDRFFDSAGPYGIDIPYTRDEIEQAIYDLIQDNELDSCYIRPIAFYGYEELGVNPSNCPVRVAIAVWPWGAYLGEDAIENGVAVQVSSWRKYRADMIPTNAKTSGAYVNSMLATTEADRRGFEESIVLDADGYVAEGPGENLFLVRDGQLITPDLSSSILEGVTRKSVITIAEDLGYEVVERRVGRGELYTADELFFTGTAAEVTPIRQVEHVAVGEGTKGPVTDDIQAAFFDTVEGKKPEYSDWLFPVEQDQ